MGQKLRPQIPRFLCLILIGLGVLCYLITAAIDVWYGANTTVSETGSKIQFLSMLVVSAFTFTFLCVSGALYRNGAMVAGIALFIPTACFIGYSATNGVGFVATETIGKTRMAEAKQKQVKDAVEIRNKELLAGRKEVVDWLKSTYTSRASNTDKDRIIEKVTETAMAPLPLQVVTPDGALADAKAEVISKWLSTDVETVQIANALWLVALLLMGKVFGPSLGFAFWPRANDGNLSQPSEEKKPPKKQALPDIRPKTSQRAAYDDLKLMLKGGAEIPSQAFLAKRWGVSEVTVHTWLGKWPEFHRDPAETGRRNRIVLAHANGNGRLLTQ